VKLDLMMLANHAEVQNGLMYVSGGGWDTINVQAPTQGVPPDVFTVMQGFLLVKLLFHPTETDREHEFRIAVMDSDGKELAGTQGSFRVDRDHDLPGGWLQNVNIVLPVTGIPLPGPGRYEINLNVDGQWLGDRPFRVLKRYDD